jgi:iron complex transport system substrate-binding protein
VIENFGSLSQETCPACLQLLNARGQAFGSTGSLIKVPPTAIPREWRLAGLLFTRLSLAKRSVVSLLVLIVCCTLLSCSTSPTTRPQNLSTREFTDDIGRTVKVPARVERYISLAPNLTEIAFAVGAGDRMVGNTTFCDYPAQAKQVEKVGDTLHPSIERIIALRPQLVLVSTASQLETFTTQLADHQIAVYVTDPQDLEGIFKSIKNLGELLNQETTAEQILSNLRQRTTAVESALKGRTPVTVFYQASGEPLYTAGRDSFVTDLIRRAGGASVTADVPGAWPKFSDESALAAQPDAIILPTGGAMGSANASVAMPLKSSKAVANGRVYKINDDHLSRPGPRSVAGLEEIAQALHPEAFKKP